MLEESQSFGYCTVAHLLGINEETVQRIFQLKGLPPKAGLALARQTLAPSDSRRHTHLTQ
jgi:hypothetical protein